MEKDIFKFLKDYVSLVKEGDKVNPGMNVLGPDELESMKDAVLNLNIFKGVKKLNIVPIPSYLAYEDTGNPVDPINDERYIGQKSKTILMQSYKLEEGEDIELNEVVDLYSINLGNKIFSKDPLTDAGVWRLPVMYDTDSFSARNEIRAIWPHELENDMTSFLGIPEKIDYKKRILKMVEEALDMNDTNIPHKTSILFRMSPRSIKKNS